MTREILKYPDPRLREVAKPVATVTPEIQALVDDMAETMYESSGCSLAATQIGENHRIFVVDCAGEDEPSDFRVFINPEILNTEGDQMWNEGCLSFPGVSEEIKRAERVRVRALDRDGKPFELEVERGGCRAEGRDELTGDDVDVLSRDRARRVVEEQRLDLQRFPLTLTTRLGLGVASCY